MPLPSCPELFKPHDMVEDAAEVDDTTTALIRTTATKESAIIMMPLRPFALCRPEVFRPTQTRDNADAIVMTDLPQGPQESGQALHMNGVSVALDETAREVRWSCP